MRIQQREGAAPPFAAKKVCGGESMAKSEYHPAIRKDFEEFVKTIVDMMEGYVFPKLAENEAKITTLETTATDHESRITALEGS